MALSGAGVVPFQAELVLQGPDDRLDALTQPGGENLTGRRFGLIIAARADEYMPPPGSGRLDSRTGKALVAHDRAGPGRDRTHVQQVQGLFTYASRCVSGGLAPGLRE